MVSNGRFKEINSLFDKIGNLLLKDDFLFSSDIYPIKLTKLYHKICKRMIIDCYKSRGIEIKDAFGKYDLKAMEAQIQCKK